MGTRYSRPSSEPSLLWWKLPEYSDGWHHGRFREAVESHCQEPPGVMHPPLLDDGSHTFRVVVLRCPLCGSVCGRVMAAETGPGPGRCITWLEVTRRADVADDGRTMLDVSSVWLPGLPDDLWITTDCRTSCGAIGLPVSEARGIAADGAACLSDVIFHGRNPRSAALRRVP